ncbi:GNAT family N-acetyltransferase [Aquibium sp. LZ166]|uniref:GNAT family N-acetyltransferase n=1 Tax=Aquibium pacificus TaxID=3153579 RepID=A0ABV3SK76_9HYPH
MTGAAATLRFGRLSEVPLAKLLEHMSEPRLRDHMPLLTGTWGKTEVKAFVAAKEACWERDGLGHWAFFADGRYIGWGGFQKEGEEWDFGLVLRSEAFGLGTAVTRKAMDFAQTDSRIASITFLLAPSRRNLGALARLGARFVGEVEYAGSIFRKYRLVRSGDGS